MDRVELGTPAVLGASSLDWTDVSCTRSLPADDSAPSHEDTGDFVGVVPMPRASTGAWAEASPVGADAASEGGPAPRASKMQRLSWWMAEARTLGDIQDRCYPNAAIHELFHPWAALALVVYGFGNLYPLFLPPDWHHDTYLYNPVQLLSAVDFLSIFISWGMIYLDVRCLFLSAVCTSVLGFVSRWLIKDEILGLWLACVVLTLSSCSVARQFRFGLYTIFDLLVAALYIVGLGLTSEYALLIGDPQVAKLLFPVVSIICSKVMMPLTTLAISYCCRPGVARVAIMDALTFPLIGSEALRVAGFVVNSKLFGDIAQVAVYSIAFDIFGRLPVKEMLRKKKISCGTDFKLRARFVLPFVLVLPAAILLASGSALGAPWARDAHAWTALAAYIASCVFSDIVVMVAHMVWYPQDGESVTALWFRLSRQPRQNWPHYQPPVAGDNVGQGWAVPSPLHCPLILTDNFWHAFHVHLGAFSCMLSVFRGHFGDCYLMEHPQLC